MNKEVRTALVGLLYGLPTAIVFFLTWWTSSTTTALFAAACVPLLIYGTITARTIKHEWKATGEYPTKQTALVGGSYLAALLLVLFATS